MRIPCITFNFIRHIIPSSRLILPMGLWYIYLTCTFTDSKRITRKIWCHGLMCYSFQLGILAVKNRVACRRTEIQHSKRGTIATGERVHSSCQPRRARPPSLLHGRRLRRAKTLLDHSILSVQTADTRSHKSMNSTSKCEPWMTFRVFH
jgi:hypothetical protein